MLMVMRSAIPHRPGLARQFPVGHPVRAGSFFAQAADLVLLIGFEVTFKPFDMCVALERKDVRRETVEEEAVMSYQSPI